MENIAIPAVVNHALQGVISGDCVVLIQMEEVAWVELVEGDLGNTLDRPESPQTTEGGGILHGWQVRRFKLQ